MDYDKLLPFAKKVSFDSIGEDIIGLKPDETLDNARRRHLLEKRIKKINKIQNQMKKGRY